jgi:hypothetical protein
MPRPLLPLVVLALAAAACTKANTDYCPDAGDKFHKSCREYNRSVDAKVDSTDGKDAADAADAGDATDAAGEAGDAAEAGDAITDALEAPVEKPKPFCTPDGGECAAMADGGTALTCEVTDAAPRCVECVASTDCKNAKKPACDTKVNRCVECLGVGTECAAADFPGKPVCDGPNQKCVGCTDDSQCTGKTPVCDMTKKECRPCGADTECKTGPGVCVDWDGHCAQTGEVVTLGGAGCVQAMPNFCKASDAVAALGPMHNILIVKGPDAVAAIDPPAGAATQVLIVGKLKALVGAGSGDAAGVHLTGAGTEFYVRDLAVTGGTVGILAEGAKMAHINRCTVTGNGKGGIKTINSGFDITNNIVAGNLAGSDVGGVGFGGLRLGDIPAGTTGRFDNNTVVGNQSYGVSCKTAQDISTSLLNGNAVDQEIGCTGTACCGATDPMLDPTYHLKTGSPCIDKLTATNMSVTTDIDGGKRPPAGGKLDCGADELGTP